MNALTQLGNLAESYWDFKDTRVTGIHKIATYPAIMVAPMQNKILSSLVEDNPHYKTMLDPFHGSGVTMVEGHDVGLEVSGIDIVQPPYFVPIQELVFHP